VHSRLVRKPAVQDLNAGGNGRFGMRPVDFILIAVLAAVLAGAVILAISRKKNGSSCCGDCAKCAGCKRK